jgi:DNA-binding NtrC family response regulator
VTHVSICALMVHDTQTYFRALESAIERQGITTRQARDCRESSLFLSPKHGLQLVFTDTQLPDGTWEDVLKLAAQAPNPPKVIVVSRLVDMKLYLDALDRGAFDFIVPPFLDDDLAYVVRSATLSAMQRRSQPETRAALPAERQLAAGVGSGPHSRCV